MPRVATGIFGYNDDAEIYGLTSKVDHRIFRASTPALRGYSSYGSVGFVPAVSEPENVITFVQDFWDGCDVTMTTLIRSHEGDPNQWFSINMAPGDAIEFAHMVYRAAIQAINGQRDDDDDDDDYFYIEEEP